MPPGASLETYVGVVCEGVDAFKIVSLPAASYGPVLLYGQMVVNL
jgi:hypothetical protein